MKPARMARKRCGACGRDIPVTGTDRFRAHPVRPGYRTRCNGSHQEVSAPVPPPPRRREPEELARWTGPRLWVDADLPMG